MNVEAITFDATGTLMHCPALSTLYAEALQRHGAQISAAEVARWFPVAWKESNCRVNLGGDRFADHPGGEKGFWKDLVARLCRLAGHDPPNRFAAAELYQVFARGSSWQLFDEVESVLESLQADGFRLAVVSNWDRRLHALLDDLGLAGRFETVVVSSEVGHAKPDARIFREAVRQFGLEPVQVLHIGDHRIQDYEGAAAAGLQSFLVDRTSGRDLRAAATHARNARL